MKRKGQIQDLILLPVILLVFSIVLFFGLKFLNDFQSGTSETLSATQAQSALSNGKILVKGMDGMNAFFVVVMILAVGGLAFMLRSSPIAMGIIIFVGIAIVILSGIIGNTFFSVGTDPVLSAEANQFSLTAEIFARLPTIVGGAVLIIVLLLFAKPIFFGGA